MGIINMNKATPGENNHVVGDTNEASNYEAAINQMEEFRL